MKKKIISLLFILSFIGAGFAQSQKHAYVDLGLPSGLLWATCNVGADAPEEHGASFAWGETRSKSEFSWKNYKYCKAPSLLSKKAKLTKYCSWSDIAYKKTDMLTVLQKVDDAAADNWGDGWRMPTKMEWKELVDNTVQEWTTVNGKMGFRFMAPNGNSIFLPSTKHGRGFYWSSSLADEPYYAYTLDWFGQLKVSIGKGYRCLGYAVRPVRDAR